MSDFLKRARAEAYRRWGYFIDQAGIENVRQAGGFIEGAEWARRELLAEPSDDEVEAVAGLVELSELRYWGDSETDERIIAAFLDVRRGSE